MAPLAHVRHAPFPFHGADGVGVRRIGTSPECYISRVVRHFSVYSEEGEESPRVRVSLRSSASRDFAVRGLRPSRPQKEHASSETFLSQIATARTYTPSSIAAIGSRSSRPLIDIASFALRSNDLERRPTTEFRHGSGNQGE